MAETGTEEGETTPTAVDDRESRQRWRRRQRPSEEAPEGDRPRSRKTVRVSSLVSLLSGPPQPDREQLEREAAAEFYAAVSPSLERLQQAVPGASSPEEAYRAIESRLGPAPKDPDAELPRHPVYQGDALVYQQLRRHYGEQRLTTSFPRGWSPDQGLPPLLGG
jgi:hypothetical protein